MTDPASVYRTRRGERAAEASRLEVWDARVAAARLAAFAAGLVVAWLAGVDRTLGVGWMAVPGAAFLGLVVVHDILLRRLAIMGRSIRHYEAGLARIEERHAGQGDAGERFRPAGHPYAEDLDVFGRGSLYELVGTARTPAGQATLAAWLLEPATAVTARGRQSGVKELAPRLELREDLALLGLEGGEGLPSADLKTVAWAALEAPPGPVPARAVAILVSCLAVAAIAGWLTGHAGRSWLLAALLVEGAYALRHRSRTEAVLSAVEGPAREIGLLVTALERMEREAFEAPHLAALRAELCPAGAPSPAARLRQLHGWMERLDWAHNQLFAPVAAVLLWRLHVAQGVEAWRSEHGPSVRRWVEILGELEALTALGGFAFEHPELDYPEILDGGPCLEALDLAHPLLPRATRIPNDVALGPDRALLVISGSNMSGKSTLLRSIGVSVVLALAGAPVAARRLVLSALAPGATLHVLDSLQGGQSRFYAEISRLRQILDMCAGPLPVLFLLDEVLHGTNSHDRRIGAEAVLRALLERRAIGLATTHDLALASIAQSLAPRARNVHFEDRLEDGRMTFDYKIREGVVEHSNAIELMRAVGLPV